MRQIICILFFLFSINLFSQEICNNGIDDDGDTFIDLNDTVDCSCGIGTPPNAISLIPNPSFEQRTCCPASNIDFPCVSSWSASATPDYFNTCGYVSQPINAANLNTFPDGSGCVGVLFNSDYKEYIISCLTSPMVSGNVYTLKFNVASILIDPYGDNSNCGFNNNLGAVDLTIYGKTNCTNLSPITGATTSCISMADTNWKVLGTLNYSPSATWDLTAITFTPPVNINAIALGSPCNLPATYPPFSINLPCHPYFLFDNLRLGVSDDISLIDITSVGHYCTNNIVLKANIVNTVAPGASLQWYHNGVAIVGQTGTSYSVNAGATGVGNYQVQISNGGFCALSPIHQVTSTPPVISVYNPTICPSTSYNLLATCPVINTFTWSTGTVSNTIAVNPNTTTVYTVSGTYGSCVVQTTPTVTVKFGLSAPLSILATTLTTCPGNTLQLTAQNATGIVSWSDGAHGYLLGSTTSQSVIVKPYSTITYTLNSVFSNPLFGGTSCQANAVITISVIPSSVSVTPNNIKICPGRPITLTATGANSYTWSNGVNSNTTIVTPTTNTTYTVTGSDGICTVTATTSIRADSTINVSIAYDDYSCAASTNTLYAYGANSYTWSNGGNGSQMVVSPTVATSYSLVGSKGYCTAQASVTVNVIDPALFSISGNTLICSGEHSILTVNHPNSLYVGYNTIKGPGFPSPVVFYSGGVYIYPNTTSTYTITSYVNNAICTPVSVITVSVIPQPTVNVLPANASICKGDSINLIASGVSNFTWSNGSISNSITVSPVLNTTYTVSGSDGTCTSSITAITVSVIPQPTVNVLPANVSICNGDSVNLIVSGASNFVWSNGSISNSITVFPEFDSTYTVYGSDGACTSDIVAITVSVIPQPTVNISPTNVSICNGDSVNLIVSGASSFVWSNGSISNSITVSPEFNTTYTVSGSESGCTSSITSSVFVNQLPVVSLGSIPILCINDAPFILNGNPMNGIFSGTGVVANSLFDPVASGAGLFSVIYDYTDTNGCSNFAIQTATVNYCTGIVEIEKSIDISISPNPTNSTLSITSTIDYSSIKIINSISQTVLIQENKQEPISVSDLSNGIYFIQLLDKKGNLLKTEKFIKE